MRIPHPNRLQSQTFSATKVEFVWKFGDFLMILGVPLKKRFYIEVSYLDKNGDTVGPVWWADFPSVNEIENVYLWSKCEYPPTYKYFSNGKDLILLIEDVVKFLK